MLGWGAASLALYSTLILDLLGSRVFSNFYDLQARALLDGRFDVPAGSLGIEAFVVDGKHFLYFPPGPALLRLPVFLFTDRFDGRLTTISMLLAWIVTALIFSLLIWRVRLLLRPGAPLGRWEATTYGLLLMAGTAGSTVLFLGSIPWVYHEAYAWAIPMALGSAFALLGVIQHPSTSGLLATGMFTTGAVLSRTTAGWAVAAAVLLTAVLIPRDRLRADRHLWWKIYAAGLVPIAIGMAVNWAKFRHPYLFPIDQQVFTSLNEHRRDAIEANGGDLFSPNMIGSTLVNYFRPDGIRFQSIFPFISLPGRIPPSYGGGFIDQANRTGSIVDFMPVLCALTVWGAVQTYRRRPLPGAELLRLPMLGVVAIPGGILFYAYIAHRYTSEFMPGLLFGSAVGMVCVARSMLLKRTRRTRLIALSGMAVLVAFSVLATMAAAYNTRALANPGSVLEDYVARQERISSLMGDPLAAHVTYDDQVTLDAEADELRIIDDCQALYIGTGDEFRPWEEVDVRALHLQVRVTGPALASTVGLRLATFEGHERRLLLLERTEGGGFRLVLRGDDDLPPQPTPYTAFQEGDDFTVDVETDGPLVNEVVGPNGGGYEIDKQTYDDDWRWLPVVFRPAPLDERRLATMGVEVDVLPSDPIEVCERLQEIAPPPE